MRNYSNIAVKTTLFVGITASETKMTVASTAGYPAAPFTVIVEPDSPGEEVVLVTAITGNQWDVVRGFDGTAATSHKANVVVKHGAVAGDFTSASQTYEAVFGSTPTFDSVTGKPVPVVDPVDVVSKVDDTWGGLL